MVEKKEICLQISRPAILLFAGKNLWSPAQSLLFVEQRLRPFGIIFGSLMLVATRFP